MAISRTILRVVAGAGRRRDERGQLVDADAAADLLQLAAPLELVDERDRVDGLALRVEVERRLVDRAVARPVEVACRQDFADRPNRTGGEHHRAEDRLLSIEILRWDRGGRRSLGELVHAGQINHLRTCHKRAWTTRSPHVASASFAGSSERMFPSRPDGAVEEKAARSGLFVAISTGPSRGCAEAVTDLCLRALLAGWLLRGQTPRGSVRCVGVSAAGSLAGSGAGSSPPSGTTSVRTSTVTSVKSSTGTMYSPTFLIGSPSAILRRSTRIFAFAQISSARSVGVTEPKSDPVGPAFTSKRSTVCLERRRELLGLLERRGLLPRALVDALLDLGDAGRGRRLGELPGQEVVAGVPAGDVDDLAAQADLLDVLSEDDLHRS